MRILNKFCWAMTSIGFHFTDRRKRQEVHNKSLSNSLMTPPSEERSTDTIFDFKSMRGFYSTLTPDLE